jgi:hypothetical protein
MQYLMWYRQVLNIPVVNSCKVELIEPLDSGGASAGYRLTLLREGRRETIFTRKVGRL